MALHIIHIGKTAGTAIETAVRDAGSTSSRYGSIHLHNHGFTLRDVPPTDSAFFIVRDPVDRFVSAFWSRHRRGRPRHDVEWTRAEQATFRRWDTPDALGRSLADGVGAAGVGIRSIHHTRRPLSAWLGGPQLLQSACLAYIGRQERIDDEWPAMRHALGLPNDLELPSDPIAAHRAPRAPAPLSSAALHAFRGFFAADYRTIEICEEIRSSRGWAPGHS